jgi:hypothetical protein
MTGPQVKYTYTECLEIPTLASGYPLYSFRFSSIYRNTDHDRKKLPVSLEIGTERRAKVRPTCSIYEQYEPWTGPQAKKTTSSKCIILLIFGFSWHLCAAVSPVHHPKEGGEQTQEDDVQRQGNQKDPPA